MNLLDNDGILNVYRKNDKKSIYFSWRIDLFIVLSVLILLISPFLSGSVSKPAAAVNKVTELYLSPRSVELLGLELTETLLREFEELNQDVKIILSDGDPSTQAGPDILIFDEGDFYDFTAGHALVSLGSFINYETGDFFAIPLVSFMDLLFYNIDLLETAGFDRPPKTRDEFLNYAKTVSGSTGIYGAALSLSVLDRQALSRDIFSWIWAAGNDFWQENEMPVINTRAIIADINFLGSLYREGALAPMSFYITGDQRLEEFAQGKIAMMIASSRAISDLRKKMGDSMFDITTIPGTDSAGKYSIGISSIYTGISASSAYPEEAWSFISFLAERSLFLCEELKAVPGIVSDFFYGDYFKDDPFYSKARDIFDSSEIVSGFSGRPHAKDFETAVLEEMRVFFETGRTAQDTAAAIQGRWDTFF